MVMPIDRFDLWRLELARALVVEAAPRVSLGVFEWSKPPGNHYTTFYPTAWVRGDATVWDLVSRTADLRTHLATYGDASLVVPWLGPEHAHLALTLSPENDPDPARAARRALASLDLDRLAVTGDIDSAAHSRVLDWLDEVLAAARTPSARYVSMDLDWAPEPCACFAFVLRNEGLERIRTVRWR